MPRTHEIPYLLLTSLTSQQTPRVGLELRLSLSHTHSLDALAYRALHCLSQLSIGATHPGSVTKYLLNPTQANLQGTVLLLAFSRKHLFPVPTLV